MKHVMVTGGAGFVGTNLVKMLVRRGYQVTSIDNYSTGTEDNHIKLDGAVKYVKSDLSTDKEWKSTIEEPEAIFHLAGLPMIPKSFMDPKTTYDSNVSTTQRVLDYANLIECKVVYAGTASVHGNRYANPYTHTKWMGEELVKLYNEVFGVRTTITRFYNLYGPHQPFEGAYSSVIKVFENCMKEGKPLTVTGDGEQTRDFIHVDDVCRGMIAAATTRKSDGKTYEFCTGKTYSINQIASMFGGQIEYVPAREGEVRDSDTEISKELYEDLKFGPSEDVKQYILNRWT